MMKRIIVSIVLNIRNIDSLPYNFIKVKLGILSPLHEIMFKFGPCFYGSYFANMHLSRGPLIKVIFNPIHTLKDIITRSNLICNRTGRLLQMQHKQKKNKATNQFIVHLIAQLVHHSVAVSYKPLIDNQTLKISMINN